jgi:hypothetical protein
MSVFKQFVLINYNSEIFDRTNPGLLLFKILLSSYIFPKIPFSFFGLG